MALWGGLVPQARNSLAKAAKCSGHPRGMGREGAEGSQNAGATQCQQRDSGRHREANSMLKRIATIVQRCAAASIRWLDGGEAASCFL